MKKRSRIYSFFKLAWSWLRFPVLILGALLLFWYGVEKEGGFTSEGCFQIFSC